MEEMNTMNEVMMENEATEMVPSEPESICSEPTPIETENSTMSGLVKLAIIGAGIGLAAGGRYLWNHRKGIKNKLFGKKDKEGAEPDEPVVEIEAVEVEPEKDKK